MYCNNMITILMPIYNGIEFISESVNSVKQQTFEDWELIIGINGHLENSEVYQTAKKYENAKIFVYDLFDIKGKSNSLNKMLEYAKYDWIALLDVDDIWLPDKLKSQVDYMVNYDVIGTHCKYFGNLNGCPNIPFGDISKFDFFSYNPIINSSSLIRKESCYWENTKLEDYDMWLRLWKQGKKFYNVNTIQVLHRIHKNSFFNTTHTQTDINNLLDKYRDKC